MKCKFAGAGQFVKFFLKCLTNPFDPIQIIRFGLGDDIAIKLPHRFCSIPVGTDFEGVFTFEFQQKGYFVQHLGQSIRGNWHESERVCRGGIGSVELTSDECDTLRVGMIFRGEEPARIFVNNSVSSEHEFGKELVGVHFVNSVTRVVAFDAVFIIIVVSITLANRAVFWQSIGISFFAFVKYDKFGRVGTLSRFTQIPPEAGFFDIITTTVKETSRRFAGNFGFASFNRWSSHIWRTKDSYPCARVGAIGAGT